MAVSLKLVGVRALIDGALSAPTTIDIEDGAIVAIGRDGAARREIRAEGLLALPGIVDLHGDAFERQMMPRPGVFFREDLALLDTDRQLVANGVTTAYHGLTWSWEPGLRGTDRAHAIADTLDRLRPRLACDTRLHLRWETYNLDVVPTVLEWLARGRIHLLAFNDHTPAMLKRGEDPVAVLKYVERAGVPVADFKALLRTVGERADDVPGAIATLAAAARRRGVKLASHDDRSPEMTRGFQALGCTLCEFPLTEDTARVGRERDGHVLMGAPNVVRGGSHLNLISAASMVRAGLCDVLTSDYYYAALPCAPFRLAREDGREVGAYWPLVSTNPARAAGLHDRGEIAPGRRADIVLVDARDGDSPFVVATIVAGRPVHHDRRHEAVSLD
ncbi:MAG: alpha-D-ribose 1-methylphosphonate 5-triphosphate diphosphatase [Alphaproteobacteria bacterium]|nr:alpha-D-ribose 1-methylphosphonate 5-triphosphate diphosphatase [Alphaproteobacteria bacterium]MCW5739874.1 alpha-D-ribose 1-methylphosphonate 5-triphosphate diphosphatase [Alphaproteobacteria bacterium]